MFRTRQVVDPTLTADQPSASFPVVSALFWKARRILDQVLSADQRR